MGVAQLVVSVKRQHYQREADYYMREWSTDKSCSRPLKQPWATFR
jgi:hypothetical protein